MRTWFLKPYQNFQLIIFMTRKSIVSYSISHFLLSNFEIRNVLRVWKATHTSREEEVSTKATKPRRHTKRGVEVANRGKGKPMGILV